jgi:hypothetical protein
MVMQLAGKYLEFDMLLSPAFRTTLGPQYENITQDQFKKLDNALRTLGTAPQGSDQAIKGMIQLGEVQNEIGAAMAVRR